MPPQMLEQLGAVVQRFIAAKGEADLHKWSNAVDLTATRAGFLVCNDLDVAARLVQTEPVVGRRRRAQGEDPRPGPVVDLRRVLHAARAPGIDHRPGLPSADACPSWAPGSRWPQPWRAPGACSLGGSRAGVRPGGGVRRRQAGARRDRGAGLRAGTEILRAAEIEAREEALALGAAAEAFCQVREAELEARARRLSDRQGELATSEVRLAEAAERLAAGQRRRAEWQAELDRGKANWRPPRPKAAPRWSGAPARPPRGVRAGIAKRRSRRRGWRRPSWCAPPTRFRSTTRAGAPSGSWGSPWAVLGPLPDRAAALEPAAAAGLGRRRAHRARRGQPARHREVAGVKLSLSERRDAIRLEGLDGVGREVAARAARLADAQPGARRATAAGARRRARRSPPSSTRADRPRPARLQGPGDRAPRTPRSSTWWAASTTAPASPRTSGSTPSRRRSCAA